MRPELEAARKAVVDALSDHPTLIPWAFEFTPARSDAADTTYLSKVREAAVVIWIVGTETTDPVKNEIGEALAAERRLWVFRLPASNRDADTDALIERVRTVAKTVNVADVGDLHRVLALTFNDEIIRALEGQPGLTRLARLEQLVRASRARMILRWTATGLSESEALELADDPSVGALPVSLHPTAAEPLRIVVAEVGAGKSIAAERLLQTALANAREEAAGPIPVFLHARETLPNVEQSLIAASAGLGDPRVHGTFAAIDGLDEISQSDAAFVAESCRVIAQSHPSSRILLTSRPIPQAGGKGAVELPLLDEEDARRLVGRIAGTEITPGAASGWVPSLADAVRRPLFAILLGLNLRENAAGRSTTTGELLGALGERGIDKQRAAEILPLLCDLAAKTTDQGEAALPLSEIGTFAQRQAIIDSRIVTTENEEARFALPVFTQWFAAQALLTGTPSVRELLERPNRPDRWRYALAIAIATGPRAFVDATLEELVAKDPGFAAQVLEESLTRWSDLADEATAKPDTVDVGRALRNALQAWSTALSPLGEGVLPRREGKLMPIAIGASAESLVWGWYVGTTEPSERMEDDVVEIPPQLNVLRQPYDDWRIRRWGRWADEKGWAWRWALDEHRGALKGAINNRALSSDHVKMLDESLWLAALEMQGRSGSILADPFSLDLLCERLRQLPRDGALQLRDRGVSIDPLLMRAEERLAAGHTELSTPWPSYDLDLHTGGSFIWSPFSPQQQLGRVRAVYGAAMEVYKQIADDSIPLLAPRLYTYAMLPAVLRGRFQPSGSSGWDGPTVDWHFEPLPEGEASRVEIEISSVRNMNTDDYQRDHRELLRMRPDAAAWISTIYHYGVADVFHQGPLSDLVYEWLKRDLNKIKMTT